MSQDTKGIDEADVAKMLTSTQLLLASLQQTKDKVWQLNDDGLKKGFTAFSEDIQGDNMVPALEQFFGIVGVIQFKLGRSDLAQRLLDEVERYIPDSRIEEVKELIASKESGKQNDARQRFEKMQGPAPKQVEVDPSKAIDFKVPKGPMKG